jgi:probable rRNA maturation factor
LPVLAHKRRRARRCWPVPRVQRPTTHGGLAPRYMPMDDDESSYDIAVNHLCDGAPNCDATLVEALAVTLRRHGAPRARLSLALLSDTQIADVNAKHLDQEGPTDVIAFDLRDGPDSPIEGEVVLSVDTARREAAARGHEVESELALYAIHGLLHLLGYDDHSEADATRMHETENDILSSLGIGPVFGAPAP